MIIKVNYTVSDIYMSTSVSAVYIKVVYSGVSGGGGTWGSITGTLSNQTDLQDALDDKVPYTGATGAVSLGLYGLTAGTLTLQEQPLNGSTYKLTQRMASNDYWSIYGFASVADYGDLYFELQDNAAFADGQRFRFHYGNDSSGTPKDILVMDYNSATIDGTVQVNTLAGTSTRMVVSDSQGQLSTQAIPSLSSGGSSVNYYLNGSVNSSVAGYKQLGNTATIGAGTDFTLSGNGLIAQFLTDAGNPNRLEISGGAWNFEMFFQVSSSGGNQKFYVELLKYDGTTFTSIASSSAIPEEITGGTAIDLYLTSLAVPTTSLLVTDRLAIRVYIVDNSGGRTITLHTEDNTLCEIITTFAGGISALNGLTANTQYFATGTSGTSFNIVSVGDTHTFNFPAGGGGSMAIGGAITSATAGSVLFAGASGVLAQDNANLFWDDTNNRLGIGTSTPTGKLDIKNDAVNDGGQLGAELTTTGSGTNWSGTGFSTGYTHTPGSTVALTTTLAATLNDYYYITFTITNHVAGTISFTFGGYTSNNFFTNTNFSIIASATTVFSITPLSTFDAKVQVSIKKVTASTATLILRNSSATITNEIRASSINSQTFIGSQAGTLSLNTSTNLVGIGYQALKNNITGVSNVAIGPSALSANVYSNSNVAIGSASLLANYAGSGNTAIGGNSLYQNTSGSNNTAIGNFIMPANLTGSSNLALSKNALNANSSGSYNVALGEESLRGNVSGSYNVGIGIFSGGYSAGGGSNAITNNSIYIGYNSMALANNQTNQIVIGYQETGLGSNTTIIGNSSTITTALRGRLILGTTTDSGSYQLDVNGTARVSGNATFGTLGTGTGMYWDNTNNRLGIGTATPSVALDIRKNLNGVEGFTIANSNTGTGAATTFQFGQTPTSAPYNAMFVTNYGSGWTGGGGVANSNRLTSGSGSTGGFDIVVDGLNAPFRLFTKASDPATPKLQMYATGNLVIQNGGTFSDAGYRLDVNGTARVSGEAQFNGLNTYFGAANWRFEQTATQWLFQKVGIGTYITFDTAATSKVTINQNTKISGQLAFGATGDFGFESFSSGFNINESGVATRLRIVAGGNVLIGTSTSVASALLNVDSTTKGFLPPRMTTTQINAIATPAEGLMAYNTTISHMCVYQAGAWVKLSHSPM